jgi:4'-phosphopantetheinyl transferase
MSRFRRDEDAADFLHARLTMRALAAGIRGLEYDSIDLQSFDDARPHIAGEHGLFVSWSRSGPQAAAALWERGPVGIDIEQNVARDTAAILTMTASPEEQQSIEAIPDRRTRLTAFYRLWTAKEAILKWRGDGLRGGAKSVDIPAVFLNGTFEKITIEDRAGPVVIAALQGDTAIVSTLAFSAQTPI